MEPHFGTLASVSNQPHRYTAINSEDHDTDSLLSLVNRLSFKIDEENKQSFFNELEDVLFNQTLKDETGNSCSEIINFFIKHTSSQGVIVA